jgi:hypothetical protein
MCLDLGVYLLGGNMPTVINLPDVISRDKFVQMIPKSAKSLEIGPYNNPTLKKSQFPNVRYMDLFTVEQILEDKERYTNVGEMPDHIDIIVDPYARPTFNSDLKFDYIYSAHNIEHHPDIIYHLNEMAGTASGMHTKYFLTVPDKRYCFDHYQQTSEYTDMIEAHLEQRINHSFGSYLRHNVYATHNNIYEHWMGHHGQDPRTIDISINYATTLRHKIDSARDEKQRKFADIHAWYFTSESFMYTINVLNSMGLHPWHVDAVTPPQHMTPEFHAVMSLTRYVNRS